MRVRVLSCLASVVLLSGCMGDGNTEVTAASISATTPDSFLTYPNTQASLAAGSYDIVIGSDTAGEGAPWGIPAAYRLTITYDDGRVETRDGVWPASGTSGPSATDTGNAHETLTLDHAGGVTIALASTVNAVLILTRNGQVVVSDTASGANGAPLIDLPVSRISAADYAQAYYDAVDPNGDRDTVEKWKTKNGFYDSNSAITHVTFRDALDLGYGRDMYILKNSVTGRIAFMVQNYIVTLQPGSSSNYGPLNVDAAISKDSRYLKGTNAIEFSPANEDDPGNANGSMKITKFFTFDPSGKRITSSDLDGRGIKHMPGMCWACHGGQTMPLDENGRFQPQSLRSAKLNILGVADFEYSLQDGYHRDQMESRFKTVNSYVAETYADLQARDINDAATAQGKWSADYALELVHGRYDNGASSSYRDDFVPEGWKLANNSGASVNTELLFKRVVGPHCTGCHSLQGRAATHEPGSDTASNLGNAINFSSYEKFIAYRSRIADYVFRRGIMPMSLRNFENFWQDPDGAPAILAAALADPTLFENGHVIQPGKPVARPGADRTVRSPVQLDGSASSFAQSYQWTILSPSPTTATLSDASSARPTLTAPAGNYVLQLTVGNSKGSSSATVTYTVNGSVADQKTLTFVDDVRPLFASNGCTVCHSSTGYPGIPVYWSDEVDSNGIKLYRRVMERVDLKDPENSRLLRRPTSHTHGGGLVIDTSTPQGESDYNTILNWIREGAVCGSDTSLGCPD